MTTSNSTDFSITRDQLLTGALRVAGGVAQGDTATATQISEAAEALNMLVKECQADGMPLWAIKQYNVTLTATSSYVIGVGATVNTPKPLKIIQAFLHNNTTGIDIPMRIITRDEYNRLGNKTSTGQPIQLWYEPQLSTGTLHLFPVPDSYSQTNCVVTIVYQRPFEDFDASADTPDFPQEWYNTLKFGLADMLAPEYGLPIQARQDLTSRAKRHRETALGFGTEEGSLFLQADSRNW